MKAPLHISLVKIFYSFQSKIYRFFPPEITVMTFARFWRILHFVDYKPSNTPPSSLSALLLPLIPLSLPFFAPCRPQNFLLFCVFRPRDYQQMPSTLTDVPFSATDVPFSSSDSPFNSSDSPFNFTPSRVSGKLKGALNPFLLALKKSNGVTMPQNAIYTNQNRPYFFVFLFSILSKYFTFSTLRFFYNLKPALLLYPLLTTEMNLFS